MFVGDDLETAAGERLEDVLTDHALVACVFGVHRHRHVGEHRFGARRRDLDIIAPVIERHAVGERIFEMPEAALHLVRLDLQVRDRGLELRVPVHEALVAVDQTLFVQVDEHLDHGAGEMRVHRELLAAPVHRTAETAELAGDLAAAFRLPLPHLVDEVLAAVIGALVLPRLQLAFDDHLRCDAGMVHADDPQSILAAKALVADEDVLQRVVKRMADVQRAGDVRRRVDDREGGGVGTRRAKQPAAFPLSGPFRLNRGGIECFFHRHSRAPLPAGARGGKGEAAHPGRPHHG